MGMRTSGSIKRQPVDPGFTCWDTKVQKTKIFLVGRVNDSQKNPGFYVLGHERETKGKAENTHKDVRSARGSTT